MLDETLAYEVDDIQVVEPEDTESLAVEPDEDLVTLLTCTPYGVNSHRLLVQGHRVSYDPETTIAKEETKGQVSMHTNYLLWVIVGLAVTAAFIAGLFLWDRKQKKKMENQIKVLQEQMRTQTGEEKRSTLMKIQKLALEIKTGRRE